MCLVDDNNGELANLQIERERDLVFGRKGQTDGGARMDLRDSRVSKFIAWGVGVIGTVCTTLAVIAVTTLIGLRDDVLAIKITMNAANQATASTTALLTQRIDSHEQWIRNVDGRVYTLEGRNLRGGPELPEVKDGR